MGKSIIQEAAKGRNLTEKQIALLENFRTNGFNAKQAALDAGYSATNIYTAIRALKDEMLELAEMTLVEHAPLAAKFQGDLLTSEKPIPQANIKLAASQSILDRTGLGKKDSLKVEHEVSGGIFILPSKKPIIEGEVIKE